MVAPSSRRASGVICSEANHGEHLAVGTDREPRSSDESWCSIMSAMDQVDWKGRTNLHYASLNNDYVEALALLTSGVDPNAQDNDGFTPLHFAAQEGSIEVAQVLLDHGALVDLPNKFRNTPLWTAVFNSRGTGKMIDLLREHGANPRSLNNSGKSPLELSRLIENYDVAQFFEDLD